MSDTDGGGQAGGDYRLVAWAKTAFSIAGWTISSSYGSFFGSEEVTPTAMEEFQAKITPRPEATKPPNDSTGAELQAIDQGFAALTQFVTSNIASDDATEAETRLAALVQLVQDTGTAVTTRAQVSQKKAALSTDLDALPFSKEFTDEQQRDFAKRRSGISQAIRVSGSLADLQRVEAALTKLNDSIVAAQAMIAARQAAIAQIALANSKIDELGDLVDRGYYEVLRKVTRDGEAALAKAKTNADYLAIPGPIQLMLGQEAAARTYGDYFDTWALKAEGFLQVYAPDPSKDARSAARDARNAAADAAAARAYALDFGGAQTALDGFWNDAAVTAFGTDAAESASFMARFDTFIKNHDQKRREIKASGMPCSNKMDTRLADIRKNAIKNKNWVAAEADLVTFAGHIDLLHPISLKYRETAQLVGSMPATDEPLQSMLAAKATANGHINDTGTAGFGPAKAAFDGIGPAEKAQAQAFMRLKKIGKRTDAVGAVGHNATKAHIEGQFAAIRGNISADPGAADVAMTGLETLLDQIETWMPLIATARTARLAHDAGDTFTLLAAADADAALHRYDQARPKVEAAIRGYTRLAEFFVLEKQVTKARDAQQAATPPHTVLSDTLTQAGDLARNQGRIEDAVNRFDAVLKDPALAQMVHEAGLWIKRYDAVKARHNKIMPDMAPQKAKDTMTGLFAAATAEGEVKHDYPAAMALLDAYESKLGDARRYVASRTRVITVKKALDRAVLEFAALPNVPQDIYGGPDDTAMKAEIKAVEDKAVAGKVTDAAKEFEDLLATWTAKLKATAQLHEARDGTGSNAGHSIDRHGPDITDANLLRRLNTGIANDDKLSPTGASSKFETYEAWLQAREAGAEIVESKTHPGAPPVAVSVSDTSIPVERAAVVRVEEIIDHKGPIDKAFVGVKRGKAVDAGKGKVQNGKTYESYDELSGITKSKTLWLFEIDKTLVLPHLKPTGPVPWDGTAGSYMDAYALIPDPMPAPVLGDPPIPKPPLTSIPGKWVMMQLYPLVAGWNQEAQDYV